MLLDCRYGFVGENDPVPHAPPPVVHDGLPDEGFHRSVLLFVRRQVEMAHGDVQRVIKNQFIVSNGTRKTHRAKLIVCLHEISAECGDVFRTKAVQSGTATRESRSRFRKRVRWFSSLMWLTGISRRCGRPAMHASGASCAALTYSVGDGLPSRNVDCAPQQRR